ncbi:MAG: hypothetical protein VW492_17440, partial [Deltaproteobacteria bacterium]
FVVSSYFNVFVKIFWKVYIWKKMNCLLRFIGNKLLRSWGGLVFARSDTDVRVVWNQRRVGHLAD